MADLGGVVLVHTNEASQRDFILMATFSWMLAGAVISSAKFIWDRFGHDLVFPNDPKCAERVILHGVDLTGYSLLTSDVGRKAIAFAAEKHAGQTRMTGQPYVSHCVETGRIVCCLVPSQGQRAQDTVVAGVLHDVIDDTDCTMGELEAHFGAEVAEMVGLVTRMSQVNQQLRRHRRGQTFQDTPPSERDASALRWLVLGIVDDPRPVLIKLADRLHNMRTLYALPPRKQAAVAQETAALWCSLAARLGAFALKSELEDLCFATLMPDRFAALQANLNTLWRIGDESGEGDVSCEPGRLPALPPMTYDKSQSRGWGVGATYTRLASVVPFEAMTWRAHGVGRASLSKAHPSATAALAMIRECERELREQLALESSLTGLEFTVQGRLKSLSSMHTKMVRKGVGVDLVHDARALRVVVDDGTGVQRQALAGCYRILSVIHRLWRPIHSEFDDYIVNAKVTGYQSLHTAVVGPDGAPLEVQIRTRSMHDMAEYGAAAHWMYKENPKPAQDPRALPPTQQTVEDGNGSGSFLGTTPEPADALAPRCATAGVEAEKNSIGQRELSTSACDLRDPEAGALVQADLPEPRQVGREAEEADEGIEAGPTVGDAALRVDRTGRMADAVVVRVEEEGLVLLVGLTRETAGKAAQFASHPAPAEVYRSMLDTISMRGWDLPGQGDHEWRLEEFVLCKDDRYHRRDAFGYKMPDCTLQIVQPASHLSQRIHQSSGAPMPLPSTSASTGSRLDETQIAEKVRLLRSMLEWEAEMLWEEDDEASQPPELPPTLRTPRRHAKKHRLNNEVAGPSPASESIAVSNALKPTTKLHLSRLKMMDTIAEAVDHSNNSQSDVMVITWPDGKIHRLPSGSTVKDLCKPEVRASDRLNVNNQMVSAGTRLKDGDLVIIQD